MALKPDTITLRLDLTVEYQMNGAEREELVQRLKDLVEKGMGDGLLTGDGPAEVLSSDYGVRQVREDEEGFGGPSGDDGQGGGCSGCEHEGTGAGCYECSREDRADLYEPKKEGA